MASREYAKPPAPYSPQLQAAIKESPLVAKADTVAAVAHGAMGQRRADHVTPYIDHPRRAATLVLEWNDAGIVHLDRDVLRRCAAGALLHDVLEDTKLRARNCGANSQISENSLRWSIVSPSRRAIPTLPIITLASPSIAKQ
jgi:hypothetical protein